MSIPHTGTYINITVNGEEYPTKQIPRVHNYGGKWYFSDETERDHGPFSNYIVAEREFVHYYKFQFMGESIPEPNNIMKELVNNEKR